MQFDILFIIGPTCDQYNDLDYGDVIFNRDIRKLPPPDELPRNKTRLMIFGDVDAKEQIMKEYFCRGRHNNCNMIYLNQNLFSLHRQNVRENCTLFILFEHRGNVLQSIHRDFFNDVELNFEDFSKICNKVRKEPYNYIVFDMSENKKINGKLRINWD